MCIYLTLNYVHWSNLAEKCHKLIYMLLYILDITFDTMSSMMWSVYNNLAYNCPCKKQINYIEAHKNGMKIYIVIIIMIGHVISHVPSHPTSLPLCVDNELVQELVYEMPRSLLLGTCTHKTIHVISDSKAE